MAGNMIQKYGKNLNLAVPSGITSGDPVVVGDLHGVATTDRTTAGYSAVDLGPAVYDLSVTSTAGGGSVAIEVGDPIYINVVTLALSNDGGGKFFGHATEALAAGTTSTINVRVQQAPGGVGAGGELITAEPFVVCPCSAGKSGSAATGSTGDENVMVLNGNTFEYHILGTQTILSPQAAATGLDVAMDQTDDDGVEITRGILTNSPEVFTVGTSPAFFARCKFSIGDVTGTDDCAFGFRTMAAYQADIGSYNDMAVLNVISGDIYTETLLATVAVSTDTTDNWADGATHTLEVKVSSAGVVTYLVDGAAPTTTVAFTFTAGIVLIPFFYMLNDAHLVDTCVLQQWTVGYQ